jgi:hypothetical protein
MLKFCLRLNQAAFPVTEDIRVIFKEEKEFYYC